MTSPLGFRAIAWRKDSTGRCVDYCAGGDPAFPEDELSVMMLNWQRRPINQDPCWESLQEMAAHLTTHFNHQDK